MSGDDHWPCRMLSPGDLSVHSTLAVLLVHREEAGGVGGRDVDVVEVDAVGGADEQHVADAADRATAHVVLGDAHLGHHVVPPDDVGFVLVLVRLGRVGAVVLAVVKTVGVQADDFAPVGDVPQAIALAIGRAADALLRPIVHAALRQLGVGVLPEELARLLVEAQQAAQIDRGRIPLDVAGAVVGADVTPCRWRPPGLP